MRLLENISHPHCRISVFSWNEKYIIELEWGQLKQSFKVNHDSVNGIEQINKELGQDLTIYNTGELYEPDAR